MTPVLPAEPLATVPLMTIWSDSVMLDCCSGVDEVLDILLATPLVVTPLDIILLLVVMANVLLEGSERLTNTACMLVVEDWWLSDISVFEFDVGAILVIPLLIA